MVLPWVMGTRTGGVLNVTMPQPMMTTQTDRAPPSRPGRHLRLRSNPVRPSKSSDMSSNASSASPIASAILPHSSRNWSRISLASSSAMAFIAAAAAGTPSSRSGHSNTVQDEASSGRRSHTLHHTHMHPHASLRRSTTPPPPPAPSSFALSPAVGFPSIDSSCTFSFCFFLPSSSSWSPAALGFLLWSCRTKHSSRFAGGGGERRHGKTQQAPLPCPSV